METGIAVSLERAAGIAGALTGTARATAAEPEQGLARVPVEKAPSEAKKISEPTEHGRKVAAEEVSANCFR
jgi:hypothetical protein